MNATIELTGEKVGAKIIVTAMLGDMRVGVMDFPLSANGKAVTRGGRGGVFMDRRIGEAFLMSQLMPLYPNTVPTKGVRV